MTELEDILNEFEWHDLNPGAQFFDQVERRFFINVSKQALKIGFGHNTRRVEMIAITTGVFEDPELVALEGKEVIEE